MAKLWLQTLKMTFVSPPLFLLFFALVWPLGAKAEEQKELEVMVSLPPLEELLGRLLPEGVTIGSFLPPGAAPETFDPPPSALLALSRAKLLVAAEVPFETVWLPRIASSHKNLLIARPFARSGHETLTENEKVEEHPAAAHDREALVTKGGHKHARLATTKEPQAPEHGHDHDHDPHLWVSPLRLLGASEALAAFIKNSETLPSAWKVGLEERLTKTKAHYEKLHADIQAILAAGSRTSRPFFVYHPSWGAFAETYGLEQIALEDHGHSPGPAALARFLETLRSSRSQIIFVQPQASTREAAKAAKLVEARLESVDPLSKTLSEELKRFSQLLKADFDGRN